MQKTMRSHSATSFPPVKQNTDAVLYIAIQTISKHEVVYILVYLNVEHRQEFNRA